MARIPVEQIVVTPAISELELGKTVKLTATVYPENATDKTLTWVYPSGRTAAVYGDQTGLITARRIGECNVTVKSKDKVSTTIRIKVVNAKNAVLTSKIAISPKSLDLEIGQTAKVSATVSPANATNKGIIWTVPQGAVASVDQEGNIKPVKIGSSRIIAESVDGNSESWIGITVRKSTAPVTGIVISPDEVVKVVSATDRRRLLVGALPSKAVYEGDIIWKVADTSIADITGNGMLRINGVGITTATATTADGKFSATAKITGVSNSKYSGFAPYVTFVAPQSVEVQRGQIFMIRVKGLGGEYLYNQVYDVNFYSRYDVTTSTSNLEIYDKTGDTTQLFVWLKAPDIPGTYTITVKDKDGKFPTKTIPVKVFDTVYDSKIEYLNVSKYYISFVPDGVDTSGNATYSVSPCKLKLLYQQYGKTMLENFTAQEYNDIAWYVLKSGVVGKIEVSGNSILIYKGSEFGIAQVIFYFKSRPHLYFPVWVINCGGPYTDYATDYDVQDPYDNTNKIESVVLSQSAVTLDKGGSLDIIATITDSLEIDESGVSCNKISGADSANVYESKLSSSGNVRTVTIKAVTPGTSQYKIASNADPSKYAVLNVRVLNDAQDGGDDGGGGNDDVVPVKPEYIPKGDGVDTIVRIDYNGEGSFDMKTLFEGNLNFDLKHPIESVVYHETDDIKKIYWVDGKNVLRSMNFKAEDDELLRWVGDNTAFDSNKGADFFVSVDIEKDYAGNTRPNGVIQYILTYYNKHGQESGPVWTSDLVYLSPSGTGGAADETNTCRVTLKFKNIFANFTNYRVYSLFRSSEDGQAVSYIVSEGDLSSNLTVIDDYANQTGEDASRLLYLGSQPAIAGTLTHKDQTMFLGDITGTGRGKLYEDLENAISEMYDSGSGKCKSGVITFTYANGPKLPEEDELYPYENQLQYTSSEILTFKGGEKYRFAIVFKFADGTSTDAFWIGDAENPLYPKMEGGVIRRVVAKCKIPFSVFEVINSQNYSDYLGVPFIRGVQLMIAEATYADRSVKAQGILNPTVFNVWERFNNRLYAQASWITRPRNSGFANRHFEAIHNSTSSYGEIDCNYIVNGSPYPFYRLNNYNGSKSYAEAFDGESEYDYVLVILGIGVQLQKAANQIITRAFSPSVTVVTAKINEDTETAVNSLLNTTFYGNSGEWVNAINEAGYTHKPVKVDKIVTVDNVEHNYYTLTFYDSGNITGLPVDWWGNDTIGMDAAWGFVCDYLVSTAGVSVTDVAISQDAYIGLCEAVQADIVSGMGWGGKTKNYSRRWFNLQTPNVMSGRWEDAFDSTSSGGMSGRWIASSKVLTSDSWDFIPSFHKKHLMFVDENVVTLNSPELEANAVSFDKVDDHKLRIVGVAKITSSLSDYVVDATPGKLPGENLVNESFSCLGGKGNIDGLLSWPLWEEYGLLPKTTDLEDEGYVFPENPEDRTSDNYGWGTTKNTYWLHMWNHVGKINGFTDKENNDYSKLNSKVFANLRVSYNTIYAQEGYNYVYNEPVSIRVFNYISGQYVGINVNSDTKFYDGNIKTSLSLPGNHKYPILFSVGRDDTAKETNSGSYELMLNTPVSIEYRSTPHAVIALPTIKSDYGNYYYQRTLPNYRGKDYENPVVIPTRNEAEGVTGALLPWIDNEVKDAAYPYVDYIDNPSQPDFTLGPSNDYKINEGDRYVFIGEIYHDYSSDNEDMRYGGIEKSAIQNNRFIVAGPLYDINTISASREIIADRGDTYFQRWDCLKTMPYKGSVNGVIDITSVMLETHINIDGRTDKQRGISQLASIDTENFGSLNHVYSQKDRFNQRRDLDEDFNLDSYRSTLTWTLQKNDLATTDEWTHITLANTLKLDGDRGILRALRRMQNSIIAFQDKGISEILFNSRTQLSTTDGVPVEIANSGKVDGKRYITNKYGCINKWSIVEGKTGLYFIDNINKAFCVFTGNAVDSLSDKLGFGIWFKDSNNTFPWNPGEWNNMVSFYDREHSDIYLIKNTDDEMPCLVYNENLQAFTSFFDYSGVPMITNVSDKLVSYRNNKLWLQNEGLYCNFFGGQYDFWVQYRVTPDPFADKIWTNFDYRADFYHLLDKDASPTLSEEYLINGDRYGDSADIYKENETFTCYKVWNEYQSTGAINLRQDCCMIDPVRKKFRIWRVAIARAMRDKINLHGLDRIRNPWINLLLKKHMDDKNNQYLMQLHDIVVKYFE